MNTPRQCGQLSVTGEGPSAVVHGPQGAGTESVVLPMPDALRAWARFDDLGRYRPLSGARTMPSGWRVECDEQFRSQNVIAVVYPQFQEHIAQQLDGTLRIVPLEDVLQRQSGRYAVAKDLPIVSRDVATDTLCGRCVKTPVWRTNTLRSTGESVLPCPEPCSVLVSLCREAVLWERDLPPSVAPDDSAPWAAFDTPGNEVREQYLRTRFANTPFSARSGS